MLRKTCDKNCECYPKKTETLCTTFSIKECVLLALLNHICIMASQYKKNLFRNTSVLTLRKCKNSYSQNCNQLHLSKATLSL